MKIFKQQKNLKRPAAGAVCALAALLSLSALMPVQAEGEDQYAVVSYPDGTWIGSYATYAQALNLYEQEIDNYDNLGIEYNGKTLKAENAIAFLAANGTCTQPAFTNSVTEIESTIDGCSAIDAVYLDTDDTGTNAEIYLSGAQGSVALDSITLVPVELLSTNLSVYRVQDGQLYHEVKYETNDANYGAVIHLGDCPAGLEDNTQYYSYDGHYFYAEDQLYQLISDYKNGVRDNAVNADQPYYNYYQFLSHRSLTNATLAQAESWLSDTMGVSGRLTSYQDDEKDGADDDLSRSQYYGNLSAFWQYQYEYGANALMMLAVSEMESLYGRSTLSYTRNNLYRHAAYDNETEANASRFQSVVNSVYSHARYYISGTYSSPLKAQYNGAFFGNLAAGMNVQYSSDPYWGEKAASAYYQLDTQMGAGDGDSYTIGIKTSTEDINVYQYGYTGSKVLYIARGNDLAFIILSSLTDEEGTEWYQIQCDATMDQDGNVNLDYNYDFGNYLAYIKASDLQIIRQGTQETVPTYVRVTFDAAGGTFGGETSVSYYLPADDIPAIAAPTRDHALFTGWDTELSASDQERTYTAQYKEVDSIALSSVPKQNYELNDRLDLSGGSLTVTFADGTTEEVALNTDMVSGYDMSQNGAQTVTVTYAGCTTSFDISVSQEQDQLRTDILNEILRVNEAYADKTELTEEEAADVLNLKQTIDENFLPELTQNQLRVLDVIMRTAIAGKIRYIVEPNDYNLQVSGLTVSMPLGDSLTRQTYLEDTYRVAIVSGADETALTRMTQIASFLQNDVKDSFRFQVQLNYEDVDFQVPMILTIDKPDGFSLSEVYTVLYYDESSGDVLECYTRQSTNTISFMTKGAGSYLLCSRLTPNVYESEDPVESLNAQSESTDLENYRVRISAISIAALVIFLLIYRKARRKHKVRVQEERRVKEEEQKKEPAPPADATQAYHVFETQALRLNELQETKMLNIDDIRRAEEEARKKDQEQK